MTHRICLFVLLAACTEEGASVLPRDQLASDSGFDTGIVTVIVVDGDGDGDGYTEDDGDCDDANPFASPSNTEDDCNGFDDDCDTAVDEDCEWPLEWIAQTDDYLYGYGEGGSGYEYWELCNRANGQRFTPSTEAIQDLIMDGLAELTLTETESLIGLEYYPTPGFGFWDNDDLYEWENWATDEPDSSVDSPYVCGAMDLTTGEWFAIACDDSTGGFLCELECATYYLDADCDGWGDPDHGAVVCGDQPAGSVENGDDADDTDPNVGSVNEGVDADGDGYDAVDDCDDEDPWTNPGIPSDHCDGEDSDCDDLTDEDCWNDHNGYVDWIADDGTLWMVGDDDLYDSWSEVTGLCESLGGHLPVFNTEEEEYLFQYHRNIFSTGANYTWIGLDDTVEDDVFAWVDGTDLDYTRWNSSHPSPDAGEVDCVATDITRMSGWRTRGCNNSSIYIYCEVPCDEGTTWYIDLDGDGYGDADTARTACGPQPSFAVTVAGDCDDTDPDINEGAQEVCDDADVDEDCDQLADDDDDSTEWPTWYADGDGDGDHGTATDDLTCDAPEGLSDVDDDCDDADSTINTGNSTDTCNGLDDDCNGTVDDDCACTYAEASDGSVGRLYCAGDISWTRAQTYCETFGGQLASIADADANADLYAAANAISDEAWWVGLTEASEGTWTWADGTAVSYDNWDSSQPDSADLACGELDTDGTWDDTDCDDDNPFVCELPCTDWYADDDGDGYGGAYVRTTCGEPVETAVSNDDDCDDTDAAISPAAVEVCDDADVDEDCNELADDDDSGATELLTWYVDNDGDLEAGTAVYQCEAPDGASTTADDCDDTDADVNSSATEVCDGADNDCDGATDDGMTDSDGDGTCDAIDVCPDDSPDDLNLDGICDSEFAVTALGFWPGQTSTIFVVNAPAGTNVYIGASAAGEGSGPCLTSADGSDVCAGISSVVGLGVVQADANGNGFLQVTTPSSFDSGTQVWIQALHLDGSGAASPVMTQVVQ